MVSVKRWKKFQQQFPWLLGNPRRGKCTFCIDWSCEVTQKWQLVQHERSKLHLSKGSACPTVSEFQKMISERNDGTSLRKSSAGSFKTLKMLWCTHEAVKDIIKKRMQKVITASITQDGQGATIGVRMCVISKGRRLTMTFYFRSVSDRDK